MDIDAEPVSTPKQSLFFTDSEEEKDPQVESEAKETNADTSIVIPSSDDIVALSPPKHAQKLKAAPLKRKVPPNAAASSSSANKKAKISSDAVHPKDEIPRDDNGQPICDWTWKYFGHFIATGWLTGSSNLIKLKLNDPVTFEYSKMKEAPATKNGKKVTKKPTENILVRFRSPRGFEAGRLVKEHAKWISKLLDTNVVKIEGKVTDIPKSFSSGAETILSIKVYIHASAFAPLQPAVEEKKPKAKGKGDKKDGKTSTSFRPELEESEAEKRLRARKSALNKLFDATGLRPIATNSTLEAHRKSGAVDSKQAVLDHYDESKASKIIKRKDEKGKGKVETVDEDEEGAVDEKQVQAIFDRASKNDANLPEMDPAKGFKLNLRSYQKQALHWMTKMEGSAADAREGTSMHPLYEEYAFPSDGEEKSQSFYYSPYSGELTLTFPQASKKCHGGILADEMGLGKTIMMAALIHSNRPSVASDDSSSEDAPTTDSDAPYTPSPVKNSAVFRAKQSKLSAKAIAITSSSPGKPASGKPSATLVVCPMSLLHQWQSEIERSCGNHLDVSLYYGSSKCDIEDEIESGTDVVITSYGTLASEFSKMGGEDGKRKATARTGLYGVTWHRIILDEAHTIKSRTTNNAKACYGLKSRKRWCLSGTPIVNRLEDLYSLLHFLKLEPWSNWSFFRSFVTVPFESKDPKAIEIIQVILESILLRREKSTKDKNGEPIVPLPPRHLIEEHLDFPPKEREIYQVIYKNARSQFLGFSKTGSVGKNVTAIFAIIMRLRQAVLHPSLVLKNIKNHADAGESDATERVVRRLILEWLASSTNRDVKALEATLAEDSKGATESLCPVCDERLQTPMVLPCGHVACKDCMSAAFGAALQNGEACACPVCSAPASEEDLKPFRKGKSLSLKPAPSSSKASGPVIIEIESSDEASSSPLPTKRDASVSESDGEKKKERVELPSNPNLAWSTKLEALFKHLRKLKEDESHYHAVVFSQFTSFLDLIEQLMIKERISYVRLDGSLTQKARQRVLAEFDNPKQACVMLISLKAGGTGLNLTIANHVYMMDCWWNEAIENQAMERVHRFGQQREVTIHRFLINDSIEDKMIALQKRKTAIINAGLKAGSNAEADFNVIFGLEDV